MRYLLMLCLALSSACALAETYRWVDPAGRTVISDTPPPGRAHSVAKAGASGENTDGLSTMDAAELAIHAIARLSADIGIPQHLRELGVKEADFPYMAEMALKDGNAFSNPRKGNEKEIAALFHQAF